MNERPNSIDAKTKVRVWVYEIGLVYKDVSSIDVDYVKDRFQEAFHAIHKSQKTLFQMLVLSAGLSWREVTLFRAYKVLKTGSIYLFSEIHDMHCMPTQSSLGVGRFIPLTPSNNAAKIEKNDRKEKSELLASLEDVTNSMKIKLFVATLNLSVPP